MVTSARVSILAINKELGSGAWERERGRREKIIDSERKEKR